VTAQLNGVQEFTEVVRKGSFIAAADGLGVTRSALSKSIKRLETRLGVRLLNRSTRSLSLTPEGEIYFNSCNAALEMISDAESKIEAGTVEPSGLMRLTVPVAFGHLFMMPLLNIMALKYRALNIEVDFSDRVRDPATDGFDLALRLGPLPDSGDLVATRLGEQRLIICASSVYLERAGTPIDLHGLSSHNCISGLPSDGQTYWLIRGKEGHVVRHVVSSAYRFNNGHAMLEAAIAGCGVTQLPDWLCGDAIKKGQLQTILPAYQAPPTPISAMWPRTHAVLPKVRVLLEELKKELPTRLASAQRSSAAPVI